MAYQGINTGTGPNSGTGDTLLSGADKINSNFTEVYDLLGNGSTLAVGIVTGIVAGDNVSVSSTFGTVTVSAASSSIVVTGPSTFIGPTSQIGDWSCTGDLNYDEATGVNLKITGVATVATLGVTSVLTVTGPTNLGITTFIDQVSVGSSLTFGNANKILMGNQDEFHIYHTDSTGNVLQTTIGNFNIIGDNTNMVSASGTAVVFATNPDSNFGVELYYNNQKKLETRADGVTIIGNTRSTNFIGDGSNLTGIAVTANIQTDSLVVSGVSTLGVVTASSQFNTGIVTATGGFISGISTQAVQISFSGNQLSFSVAGIGSTTLTLS